MFQKLFCSGSIFLLHLQTPLNKICRLHRQRLFFGPFLSISRLFFYNPVQFLKHRSGSAPLTRYAPIVRVSFTDADAFGREELHRYATNRPNIVFLAWVCSLRKQHLRREIESIRMELCLSERQRAGLEEIDQEPSLAVVEDGVQVEPVVGKSLAV